MKRLLTIFVVLSMFAGQAAAADYPSKPIRFLFPGAGGGLEVLTRLIGQKLDERWGQQVLVEPHPGAGGGIALKMLIGSAPDGYTLMSTPSTVATLFAANKKLAFDARRDLTPVMTMVEIPFVLAINAKLPVHSVAELIAYAKANPGKLNYGSSGIATTAHLAGELFKSMAGIDMVHVPNKGMGGALADLLGGQVQLLFGGLPLVHSDKTGLIRILAIGDSQRASQMPDIPTVAESGLPGFAIDNFGGVVGPAALDRSIVDRLHDEIVAILATPDVKQKIVNMGFESATGTPEQFAVQLQRDLETWAPIIERVGPPVE
jgi:tripartite-type tricarboxylate transporter receptor subunit TctC